MPPSPIVKALIPMARANHAALPLQTVLGIDGRPVPVISHLVSELLEAGINEVCLVVNEASHSLVSPVLASFEKSIRYVWQTEQRGFGHALWCAREWAGGDPVLVQVCDHVFLSSVEASCVRQMIETWTERRSSLCGIQRVREVEVPTVGVVSGKRLDSESNLYLLEAFLEKPSLTKAELLPHIPGLGANEYLCSAGIFIFSPLFFDILQGFAATGRMEELRWLASPLSELMRSESLFGLEVQGRRVNLEETFGLVRAQIAMGLASPQRAALLALMLEEAIRGQG
jgi:UTP--glucose-1-phosphate uridylyltransferase